MSIIITGASGCIGRAMLLNIPRKYGKIYAVYNRSTDFKDFLRVNRLQKKVEPIKCALANRRETDKTL